MVKLKPRHLRTALLKKRRQVSVTVLAVFGVACVLTGYFMIRHSYAAGTVIGFEAEAGSRVKPAQVVATTGASGGGAIQFGSAFEPSFGVGVVDNCSGVSSSMCNAAGYAEQAQLWHDAGITSVRTWLGCNVDATTRWNKDLKYYMAQGVVPILVIACGRDSDAVAANGFQAWFPAFVKTMSGYGVHNYEFGNEMNGNTQWHTTANSDAVCGGNKATASDYPVYVQQYVDWLQQGYTLAHASDARAYIISGGVEYSTVSSYCIVPSKQWITEMVKDHADRYMDGFGYHPYTPGGHTPAYALSGAINEVTSDNYTAIKKSLGITDTVPERPMWITEVGFCLSTLTCSANGVLINSTEADRASLIKPLFDGFKAAGVHAPVDWYWDAGDGYGLESGGTAAGCTFGSTTLGAYTGHVLMPTMCAIKAYQNP